jgi:hypothetical protein
MVAMYCSDSVGITNGHLVVFSLKRRMLSGISHLFGLSRYFGVAWPFGMIRMVSQTSPGLHLRMHLLNQSRKTLILAKPSSFSSAVTLEPLSL